MPEGLLTGGVTGTAGSGLAGWALSLEGVVARSAAADDAGWAVTNGLGSGRR